MRKEQKSTNKVSLSRIYYW